LQCSQAALPLLHAAMCCAGDQQASFVVEFEEPSGSNPLVEMMMKGMAASADAQVQKELTE
jgi:hypothetical protein